MSDSPFAELAEQILVNDRRRADDAAALLRSLTTREQWLVREAAVMGFVLGERHGRAADPDFPRDLEIVAQVVTHCGSNAARFPLLAGDVYKLARKLVRQFQPVATSRVAEAMTVLTTLCLDEAESVIAGLVQDELLAESPDGLREAS